MIRVLSKVLVFTLRFRTDDHFLLSINYDFFVLIYDIFLTIH